MRTVLTLLVAENEAPPPLVDIDGTIFIQFGIFVVLLLVLTKLVFRPYLALLKERDESIDGAKEEAARMKAAADRDLGSYEDRIIKARKDAASVRVVLRGEGEREAEVLMAEARSQAQATIAAARERIQKSADAARLALRVRADQIAEEITHKLLHREV